MRKILIDGFEHKTRLGDNKATVYDSEDLNEVSFWEVNELLYGVEV